MSVLSSVEKFKINDEHRPLIVNSVQVDTQSERYAVRDQVGYRWLELAMLYNCTPQNPLPPQTPSIPKPGAQLMLATSKADSQTALGPLSWLVVPGACAVPRVA